LGTHIQHDDVMNTPFSFEGRKVGWDQLLTPWYFVWIPPCIEHWS